MISQVRVIPLIKDNTDDCAQTWWNLISARWQTSVKNHHDYVAWLKLMNSFSHCVSVSNLWSFETIKLDSVRSSCGNIVKYTSDRICFSYNICNIMTWVLHFHFLFSSVGYLERNEPSVTLLSIRRLNAICKSYVHRQHYCCYLLRWWLCSSCSFIFI